MLLRFVAIALLVLIALRLLGRMVATFLGGPAGRRPTARNPTDREARPAAGRPPEQRQLEPCPHCGTYFDPERALAAPGGNAPRFCSAASWVCSF